MARADHPASASPSALSLGWKAPKRRGRRRRLSRRRDTRRGIRVPRRGARIKLEAPSMISTDQSVPFDFALSEQGALMRTASLEGSEPGPGPNHHDVYPVRRDGEGTGAFELIQIGYANKGPDLHEMASEFLGALGAGGARRERPAEWGSRGHSETLALVVFFRKKNRQKNRRFRLRRKLRSGGAVRRCDQRKG